MTTEKNDQLERIADALERLAPKTEDFPNFDNFSAFMWHFAPDYLEPVKITNAVYISLLKGIDQVRDILLSNTMQFANGFPANNALLWGARGMGKSSLVKAVHTKINNDGLNLKIVELQRDDLGSVSRLLKVLRGLPYKFILFCDDLSFSYDDQNYKSLKAILDGGLEGRPENVIFYATSNRRHLMPRDMIENERSSSINPSEAVEEKISLSDRFGLWLGFHPCSQDEFFDIIEGYVKHYNLIINRLEIETQATEWARTRGSRSGRVAWQFFVDLAGKHGLVLKLKRDI
ncbi:MAG: ATP-binding protein [Rhodobacterales bacterium]|nr:ATP-binding protein [Rhodobacterales bacterium]